MRGGGQTKRNSCGRWTPWQSGPNWCADSVQLPGKHYAKTAAVTGADAEVYSAFFEVAPGLKSWWLFREKGTQRVRRLVRFEAAPAVEAAEGGYVGAGRSSGLEYH